MNVLILLEFSRLQNSVPQTFTLQLTDFLGQLTSKADIINSGVPLIASGTCILPDNNPPSIRMGHSCGRLQKPYPIFS